MTTHLVECPWCMGSGTFRLHYSLAIEVCPSCNGTGILDLQPQANHTVPHKLTVTTIIHEDRK